MKKGNKFFEDLYRRERKSSRMIILRTIKDEDIADDLCEDVFVRLYEMRETLDMSNPVKLHALIFVMSHNMALDYLKKSRVKKEDLKGDISELEIIDERYDPETVFFRMEEDRQAKMVFQKLRRTNPVNYDILLKVKYMGRSPCSVAEEYGITENNVNNRIHRTKRWFLKEMELLD